MCYYLNRFYTKQEPKPTHSVKKCKGVKKSDIK